MVDDTLGFKSFENFLEQHEGSVICSCDHGCNQWILRQSPRMALAIRMMRKGSTNLDKMAALPLGRVNKIWYWVQSQDNRRWNKALREGKL